MDEKKTVKHPPRFLLLFVVAMVLVCALSTLAQMQGGRVGQAAVDSPIDIQVESAS